MTEQSSCKRSFFRDYLLYRIGTLKGNLFVSLVLNLLGLPFFALGHLHMSSARLNGTVFNRDFFGYTSFVGPISVYSMMILAVIGAAVSFSYYNKKELTDTLGVLPLSHKERFWGDLLGGYAANIAPFIPCAVIAAIMFGITQNNYTVIAARTGGEPAENYIAFIIGLSLSLLFVYTFGYIISALVSAIIGRFMFAEIFSVIGTVIFTVAIMGVSGTFVNEITGITGSAGINRANAYAMPFGLLFGEVGSSLSNAGGFSDMIGKDMEFFEDFMIFEPLNIVIFTAAAAALTILAYYISKSRKQERVGKIVVHKAAFRGMGLFSAGAAIMLTVSLRGENALWINFLIGAAIGAVVLTVFEVILRTRTKELSKTVIGYSVTLVGCLGLCILFNGTGAFGLRYFNAAPEDIEYIEVGMSFGVRGDYHGGVYKITDKADIGQFTERHNSLLRSESSRLRGGKEFIVEYKLTDGSTISRGYERRNYGTGSPLAEMSDNLYSLEGFPKALCGFMTDGSVIERCTAAIEGVYGNIGVPVEKISEFLEIFSSEIIEKYSKDAETCGIVQIVLENAKNNNRSADISVQKNYTKTIDYLRALESSGGGDDQNKLALTIAHGYSFGNNDFGLSIHIYKKDLDDGLVKELFTLLKRRSDLESGNIDAMYMEVSKKIAVTSTDLVEYYVPASAEKRVTEIMLELAEMAAQ